MKKYKLSTTLFWLFYTLNFTVFVGAQSNDSLFYQDDSARSEMKVILNQTSLSYATDDLSFGFINEEVLKQLSFESVVSIKLPDMDSEVVLQVNRVDHNVKNVITYSGEVIGFEGSKFIVSNSDERLLGSIKIDGYSYNIEPSQASDNHHVINKVNRNLLQQDSNDVMGTVGTPVKSNNDFSFNNGKQKFGTVNVLFLYANDVLGPELASHIVTEFNNVAELSGLDIRNKIAVAGVQLIDSDFSDADKDEILTAMAEAKKEFVDIKIRRKSVNADIVVMLYSAPDEFDFNKVGGLAYQYDPNNPYAVVADDYVLGDLTATHEIGHIFGGGHVWPLVPDSNGVTFPSSFAYGHGVKDTGGQWQTIMGSYEGNCLLDQTSGGDQNLCKRIDYFSNITETPPPITGNDPIGDATRSDMVRMLAETMPLISNWGTFELPNYSGPVKGFSFDPQKNGHGIHITQSGSASAPTYHLVFYTYDENNDPEWYIGTANYANNKLMGNELLQVTYDRNTDPPTTTSTVVGNFSIDYNLPLVNASSQCDGRNRASQPGVFNWQINDESGSWCVKPLFLKTNKRPSIPFGNSGLWYEPSVDGWGISLQIGEIFGFVQRSSAGVVYYYDDDGIGRWVIGSTTGTSENSWRFNVMNNVTGYPRTSTGNFTTEDIGHLYLTFSNTLPDRANFRAMYPDNTETIWNRPSASISRLAQ